MDIKNLQANDLPEGTYEAEIFDLFTVRIPKLMIIWLLDIKNGDFAGSRIEYSYPADESSVLTSKNFDCVGVDSSNLEAVLENSKLVYGQKIRILKNNSQVCFEKAIGAYPVRGRKVSRIPF
ncbi:MAG TPA: hypothetical protein PKY82_02295 [Pyrinomonadaceae bacterium]|nr:hypothetical protein [Pyrinomonadaceae bacterium]